jgi:chorismate synthase
MLRFSTAGESHGESLVALLSGMPAGVPIDEARVNRELWRRQQGYGRGGRMRIETDTAHILSGVRHGKTIGSPIAMTIEQSRLEELGRDSCRWRRAIRRNIRRWLAAAGTCGPGGRAEVRLSRCAVCAGAGVGARDRRRAWPRGVAKHAAAGAGHRVASHVIRVGGAELERDATWEEIAALRAKDEVLLNCVDAEAERG